ncbi:uncharacterized protein [Amphiura filiformis]|uniref:uncharacterized protein n=1 Tax=Amphiura filiformis TaxID=82378 RepID=UPI003B21F3B2
MVLYKGVRINKILVDSAPEGWKTGFTKNGWVTSIAFEKWFDELFVPYVNKYVKPILKEKKIILLLDGHRSHETLHLLTEAKKHDIEIVCLPPNTTHVLQPLDVSCFKSLKCKWDSLNERYCREHHGSFVTKGNFTRIFSQAWNQVSPQVVSNGFSRIGICPFKKLTLSDILKDRSVSPAAGLNRPTHCSTSASTVLTEQRDNCDNQTEANANKDSTAQNESDKDNTVQNGSDKDNTAQKRSDKDNTAQNGSDKDNTAQNRSDKDNTGHNGSGKDNTAPIESSKDNTAQHQSGNNEVAKSQTESFRDKDFSRIEGSLDIDKVKNHIDELSEQLSGNIDKVLSEPSTFIELDSLDSFMMDNSEASSSVDEQIGLHTYAPGLHSTPLNVSSNTKEFTELISYLDEGMFDTTASMENVNQSVELNVSVEGNQVSVTGSKVSHQSSPLLEFSLSSLASCSMSAAAEHEDLNPRKLSESLPSLNQDTSSEEHASNHLNASPLEEAEDLSQHTPDTTPISECLPSLNQMDSEIKIQHKPDTTNSLSRSLPSLNQDTDSEKGVSNDLSDIFVVPKFDCNPSKRKPRKTTPYCRVLTSASIIEEKTKQQHQENEKDDAKRKRQEERDIKKKKQKKEKQTRQQTKQWTKTKKLKPNKCDQSGSKMKTRSTNKKGNGGKTKKLTKS